MTEEEARSWIVERHGPEAVAKLAAFADLLTAEAAHQNLIAPSTLDQLWARHIVDSAQLLPLAEKAGMWLDIGTGGGFPGIVIAILRPAAIMLVEPRRRRADFLAACARDLSLDNVSVHHGKVDGLSEEASIISARAVAPLEKLLHVAAGCATSRTRWLLPRGRSGAVEMIAVQQRWTGVFHVKQSLTDAESVILVCDGPQQR